MTTEPATVTRMPPPPADTGSGSGIHDPWLTTAADLLAVLAERPDGPAERLVPTGDPNLDSHGGLAPGTLTAVVGRPGPDTTAALIAAAHHAAYRLGLPTLLYPLRSTLSQIAERLARIHLGTDVNAASVETAVRELRDSPLYVTFGSPITVTRIHFDAIDPDMATPPLIVVDAVDLLLPAGASRDLKLLALDVDVAVLCSTTVHGTAGATVAPADVAPDVAAAADIIVALDPSPTPSPPP